MKKSCLIAAVCVLSASLSSLSAYAETAGKPRSPRGELVHRIVMKWGGHVQEAYGADVRMWASDMVPVFSRASLDTLKRAADARSFDAMNEAFLGARERSSIAQNALVADAGTIAAS